MGDHRMQAEQLKRELEEAKMRVFELERDFRALGDLHAPSPKYGKIKVHVKNVVPFGTTDEVEVVRFTSELVNGDQKEEHIRLFGSINGDWKEFRNSTGIYRNEHGILTREGGGYVMLKDCIPCSDEEWEDIKRGNPADKFKNMWFE